MPTSVTSPAFLRVQNLSKHFAEQTGWWTRTLRLGAEPTRVVKAVDDVSFEMARGETLGLVGESGCGKTTLARVLLRLTEPTAGKAWLEGQSIFDLDDEALRTDFRSKVRMIFQHPDAALNPAYTVMQVLDQALRLHTGLQATERKKRAEELLSQVQLAPSYLSKSAQELSGGQKRRVGLCRALATEPQVIVADEPFSGLDVSLREEIVRLFQRLQAEHNLTVILISHDIGLVERFCDRVGIMKEGRLVEMLAGDQMKPEECSHPYATSLLRTRVQVQR